MENLTKPPETVAISESAGLMQPEKVARALVKGMRKGKFYILPGGSKMLYYTKRFVPWLVDMVMDRQIRKVQKG